MWIVLTALRRPYTFVVLALLIALFGIRAALTTPTDIFPNINIPVISVVWSYNGLPPNDMSGRVIYYYERYTDRPGQRHRTYRVRSRSPAMAWSRSSSRRTSISPPRWRK